MSDIVTFLTAYNSATEEERLFIDSEKIGSIVSEIPTLDNTSKHKLIILFSDYFLNLVAKDDVYRDAATILDSDLILQIIKDVDSYRTPESSPLSQMPPVRTMATDMQLVQEKGSGEYSSNQDALLKRNIPTPPPSDPEEARWNSTDHY